jgi:hypothetical protein
MKKGIPFVTIADRVEVNIYLKVRRTSGPALVFKEQGARQNAALRQPSNFGNSGQTGHVAEDDSTCPHRL